MHLMEFENNNKINKKILNDPTTYISDCK